MPEISKRAVKTAVFAFLLAALISGCFGRAFAAETLFDRAKNLYDVREYKFALAYFQKVIESEPENGEAWDFAGWCHRYNGDWESALAAFARAKELLPREDTKWVKVGEGEVYYGAGVYDKAVNAFAEAISLAPDDEELAVRAAKGIIFAYAALNDSAAVKQTLADLGEEHPGVEKGIGGEADALLAKAREKADKGDAASGDEAAKDADDAQKITDSNDRFLQAMEELTSGDVAARTPEPSVSEGPGETPVASDDTTPVQAEPDTGGDTTASPEEPPVSGDDATPVQAEPTDDDASVDPGKPPIQAEPTDAGTSSDTKEPAKDAEPPAATEAKSWELPALGAPIADVLAKLGEDGISAGKAEVATSEGLWLYVLSYPSGIEIPDVTGEKPDSKNSHIEEFDGKLIAVVVTNSWENHENSVIFKDELFAGAVAAMDAEIGSDAAVNEADLFSEAQWISPDGRHVIGLSVSATLEGNVTAEKVYNDMTGLMAWKASLETAGGDN